MKKILILKTGRKEFDAEMMRNFNNYGSVLNIEYILSYYDDITIEIDTSNLTMSIGETAIEEFSLVYFKSWREAQPLATAISRILGAKSIPFIDSAVSLPTYGDKVLQNIILTLNNISVPHTIFSKKISYDVLEKKLGSPFIMKAAGGKEGEDNFLISNKNEFEVVEDVDSKNFIFQEFIPNNSDYRVVVIGGRVVKIKQRTRQSSVTHLNNVSQGAKVDYLNISENEELSKIAIKASQLFAREIAGVDIVTSTQTDKHYVLEVNPSPAMKNDFTVLEEYNKYFAELINA